MCNVHKHCFEFQAKNDLRKDPIELYNQQRTIELYNQQRIRFLFSGFTQPLDFLHLPYERETGFQLQRLLYTHPAKAEPNAFHELELDLDCFFLTRLAGSADSVRVSTNPGSKVKGSVERYSRGSCRESLLQGEGQLARIAASHGPVAATATTSTN